jgi:hypothetical protein
VKAEALDAAVGEATSALAFADPIPVDHEVRSPDRFGIDLLSPQVGRLFVEVSPADLRSLAEAAWGAAFADQPEVIDGFVAELLNVVAGRYLALGWPDEPVHIGFAARLDGATPPSDGRTYDVGGATVRFAVAA